jgi:hypothetical protein
MRELDIAETKDLEWEPTEEDREEYGRVLDDYYDQCREWGQWSSGSDLNWMRPLWHWLQLAGLPLTDYAAGDFWLGERRREEWISAKLLWVTEGMPQPARRRMTLRNLSEAQWRLWRNLFDGWDSSKEQTRPRLC